VKLVIAILRPEKANDGGSPARSVKFLATICGVCKAREI
jgi:hypothetical protein